MPNPPSDALEVNASMKFISWNVNGLRSCVAKGFLDYIRREDADIVCVQETKLQEGQLELDLPAGYRSYWNCAERKGYSGTAVFTRLEPLSVRRGLADGADPEGRIQTLEFPSFFLVNVYTPNARRDLSRLDYRIAWEAEFRAYLKDLDARKPVVVCGDLNVAHREIDLKNARSNRGNAGFTDEEREAMTRLLESGFIDTFRHFYPDRTDAYTWWSFMPKVRERNIGWRIDYFLVSRRLAPYLEDALIRSEVMGSDHCPVGLLMRDPGDGPAGRQTE
jgi:exodeoxyribonuclease-3